MSLLCILELDWIWLGHSVHEVELGFAYIMVLSLLESRA